MDEGFGEVGEGGLKDHGGLKQARLQADIIKPATGLRTGRGRYEQQSAKPDESQAEVKRNDFICIHGLIVCFSVRCHKT